MRLLLLLPLLALLIGCRTNESPEGQVNDLEIATQIKSKLASGVGLSTLANVAVNSTNGVVTLSGQVDSAEAKAKAETLAMAVPKVVRVLNDIQVVVKKVSVECYGQSSLYC
jgi:osmotically-inducible protein OsmY